MDKEKFKEKLLELIVEEDEVLRLNLIEEISNIYVGLDELKEDYKRKYEDIQTKYVETFLEGKKVEEKIDDEVIVEDDLEDITFEDLFKEVE